MAGALTKWEPIAELGDLRTRFDRMFSDLVDGHPGWIPAIDVERENGNLIVRADVPGIKAEEVRIEVQDDVLTVSGEHQETTEEEGKHYVRRERRSGAFTRSMALPSGVDAKQITATTHDGVVEVKIPLPNEVEKQPITITPTAA